MDIKSIFRDDEKPLDNLINDGGFCGIFRTIGCIGDSLSSGEFEYYTKDEPETKHYHDNYDYSWGQYIARAAGCKVFNLSKGGLTTQSFLESYADECGAWSKEKRCQAYIIALGVNDWRIPFGTEDDIKDDYRKNGKTYMGCYAAIIGRIKALQPDAKLFFVTMPRENPSEPEKDERAQSVSELLNSFAKRYTNSYVIDLFKYAPVYDGEWKKLFFMGGHMNPCGYVITAKIIISYIDYIIRHNMKDFKQVGFIGTEMYNNN